MLQLVEELHSPKKPTELPKVAVPLLNYLVTNRASLLRQGWC